VYSSLQLDHYGALAGRYPRHAAASVVTNMHIYHREQAITHYYSRRVPPEIDQATDKRFRRPCAFGVFEKVNLPE
jgi:hypothetical protein